MATAQTGDKGGGVSDYDIGELVKTYDKYADERDQAGLDGTKRAFVDEAIERFRRDGVRTILEIGSGPGSAAGVIHDYGRRAGCRATPVLTSRWFDETRTQLCSPM